MAESQSKLSKFGEEVAKHTAWHFTGAPLLETAGEKWRKWVISVVPSVGASIIGKLTGVGWWWAIALFCLTFGVFWFGWHYFRWRHAFAHAAAHPVEDRRQLDSTEGTEPLLAPAGDPELLKDAPSMVIDYIREQSGRTALLLSNEVNRAAVVRTIHSLHCRETFESDYELTVSPRAPQVTSQKPVRCEIFGARNPHTGTSSPLEDVLRRGAAQGSASILIDYDSSDGRQFSRRFHLTRNIDDSITFTPSPVARRGDAPAPQAEPQDLAALHHKLTLLQSAKNNLEQAGRLAFLAEQTQLLIECFAKILSDHDTDKDDHFDLSQPLSRAVVYLEDTEKDAAINKYRLRMMSFRDRYNQHQREVCACSGEANPFGLPPQIPNQLERGDVLNALAMHSNALLQGAVNLETPYLALSS